MYEEFFLGQIIYTAYIFKQRHWMLCEGQTLAIAEYQALYSLLGTRYGGDGTATFCLPDLRDNGVWPANKPVAQMCVEGMFPGRD